LIICARSGCDIVFERKTHNQKYHDDECCRLATNERIMEKYYERRDQRLGKVRVCRDCRSTKLSRYNNSLVCSSCDLKREIAINDSVLSMLSAVSWQA
jgi:hypothetical protein